MLQDDFDTFVTVFKNFFAIFYMKTIRNKHKIELSLFFFANQLLWPIEIRVKEMFPNKASVVIPRANIKLANFWPNLGVETVTADFHPKIKYIFMSSITGDGQQK